VRRAIACLLAAALAAGCGSGGGPSGGGASGGTLDVFAATSLTDAFTDLARTYEEDNPGWEVRLQFAGSDVLAAQLRQGAPADVFAAASPNYAHELADEGLLDAPRPFAANSLVLLVPAGDPAGIDAVADLRDGAKLVIGDASVPVGGYTREALEALGIPLAELNVVSEETNVGEVVAKVALGEADAGFAYVTDARAAGDDVEAIALPPSTQPTVTYPIAAVREGDRDAAERWIALVRGAPGQEVLRGFGFEPAR
jgi:molybdate transport system substrate-binding protein